jgi:O-antigen ligase
MVSVILSVAMIVCGGILMLFKKSISHLFGGSVIFSLILKLFKISAPELISKKDVKKRGFVVFGALYGITGALFGIYPLLCAVILTAGGAFAFYKTDICVIITAGILPFMPTMVMVALCLGIAGVIFVKAVLSFRDSFEKYSCVQNIFILFMCVAFALCAVFSVARSSSIKIVLVYIAFTSFYFSFVKTVKGKKGILSVLYTLSVVSLPVALYGIYQKIVGFDEQNTWIDTEMFESISGRVVSTFENPNVFGEYLIIAIMLCVAAMTLVKSKRYKVFYAITLVCLAAAMVFTYSRGCWIGVVCAVAIYLFMTNRKLFWTAAALGIVSLFFLPESIMGRIASVGNMSDSSTSYRVYIWMGTLRLLADYWFTGIGHGSDAFNIIYPAYSYSAIEAPHAHNLYLLILTEMGVLGAAAFIGVIFVFFRKLFYVIKNSAVKEYRIVAAATASGMAGFLIQGMFDNVWYNYRVFLYFWLIIAFGISVYIADKKREDRGKFYR